MERQLWSAIAIVVLAQMMGMCYQTHHLDKRIDDLRDGLKDWIRSELKRIEDRLEPIEHPIYRP